MPRTYTARMDATNVSVAKTLVEVTCAANKVLKVLRAWITQETSEASNQLAGRLFRLNSAGTGTAGSAVKHDPGDANFAGSVRVNIETEGSAGDTLSREGFNALPGLGWVYVPEEGLWIPGGGIIGLGLVVAPDAAIPITAGITFVEYG